MIKIRNVLVNSKAAIDLASIMVGIIVIGLIGGVIAATIFAVIPWAQDNATKISLDSVVQAESAYVGLSLDGSVPGSEKGGSTQYANYVTLVSSGLINDSDILEVQTSVNKQCYIAVASSPTGKKFFSTSKNSKAQEYTGQTFNCEGLNLSDVVGGEQGSNLPAYADSAGYLTTVGYDRFGTENGTYYDFLRGSFYDDPTNFPNLPYLAQFEGQPNVNVTVPLTNANMIYTQAPEGTTINSIVYAADSADERATVVGDVTLNIVTDAQGKLRSLSFNSVDPGGFYLDQTDDSIDFVNPEWGYATYLHFNIEGKEQYIRVMPIPE